ncbi:MAG TPA: cysteine dioxygenase family protein [Candidatus Sulfotelmatobacter sp.]|nr:cysteine dioxygenase family protein [Candidatus Sulfotelmatobacter sp.]
MHAATPPPADLADVIGPIERAVVADRVTGLARVLAQLEAAGAFAADLFPAASADHYQRRLIHRDPHDRFVVVGMTWEPGQASALHDHAGLWGAEIVVRGTMEETAFRLLDRDVEGRYKFRCQGEHLAPPSCVGILIPPLEYHSFRNVGTKTAHTVHVYGGAFEFCRAFSVDDAGWWRAARVDLSYDA